MEGEMGKFMPFKKKGQSNMGDGDGDEFRQLPESPEAEVKAPKKKKKKKGKKSFAHDSKTKDGKVGGMLKGSKGKKVVPAPPGKGKRPVPPQFAKGKKNEKSRATVGSGSIAEDIFA
jgi:hypothetical protein